MEQLFLIMRWFFWWWKGLWSSYQKSFFCKNFLFFGCFDICVYCIDNVTNVTMYLNSQLSTCLLVYFVADVQHCFTSGFWCFREKVTPVWNFTLVSQTETEFQFVWVSLARSNVNAHNEFTLPWSKILTRSEISNWCEFISGLK